jgi:hypothetical protein
MLRSSTALCLWLAFFNVCGQSDPCKPPVRPVISKSCNQDTIKDKPKKIHFKRESHRDFQFNGLSFKSFSDSPQPISFQINSVLKETFYLRKKHHELAFEVFDESSFSLIVDSLAQWERDALRISLESKTGKTDAQIQLSGGTSLESNKFNKYKSSLDSSGQIQKLKESAFLAPGILRMQSGVSLRINDQNELELGLAAAKITWIRLKSLYDNLNTEEIQGVKRGLPFLFEGGISMKSNFTSSPNKKIIWEQTCRIFYPIQRERTTEMEMLNKLSVDLNDGLKTSLVSRYSYNENRWPPSRWDTELRIGFEFKN